MVFFLPAILCLIHTADTRNPTKGGNRGGDYCQVRLPCYPLAPVLVPRIPRNSRTQRARFRAQVYHECRPFDFERLCDALERSRPGLMEQAVAAWRRKQQWV